MLKECLAVMKAQGIEVVDLPGTPVRALAFATTVAVVALEAALSRRRRRGTRRQDAVLSHRPAHGRGKSEVEYLHGAVVRAGENAMCRLR
jgi:2-dehydropantoate 2-reductase